MDGKNKNRSSEKYWKETNKLQINDTKVGLVIVK